MENLPKDIQRKLALELSPRDLVNFCLTDKSLKNAICDSKDFWRQKLMLDFPKVFNFYKKQGLVLVNPKNTYIRRFKDIFEPIENFVSRYYHSKYNTKEDFFNKIFKIYNESNMLNYHKTLESYFPAKTLWNFKDALSNLLYILLEKDKIYDN